MVPGRVKLTETERRRVGARGSGGVGDEELVFNGDKVSVLQDEEGYEDGRW